MNIYLHYKKN